MKLFRHHIISSPLAFILSLMLLNISVDVIDRSVNKPWEEQQSYNEIESLVELITEIGLQMNDIIPENDDEDNQSIKGKQAIKYFIVKSQRILHATFNSISYHQLHSAFYRLFETNILIPPPEIKKI